jgi:hypothetical protein
MTMDIDMTLNEDGQIMTPLEKEVARLKKKNSDLEKKNSDLEKRVAALEAKSLQQ